MALAPCRECELRISTKATQCPRCGALNPTGGRTGRWIGATVAVVVLLGLSGGFVVLFNFIGANPNPTFSNDAPSCNNAAVTDQAKKAIEGTPVAKAMHVRVLDIRESQEVQYDLVARKRWCSAVVLLDSGQQPINYTAEWTEDRPRQVWVQVEYEK